MKFNELDTNAKKSKKRVGRGISAGGGKTAGRGTKGQNSRAGGGVRLGFEGGQNPLMQRLPKLRGFKSHRAPRAVVYTGQLNQVESASIDSFTLSEAGLVPSPYSFVKLIEKGEIKSKKTVKVQAASKGATQAVKRAGGSVTILLKTNRPAKENKPAKK